MKKTFIIKMLALIFVLQYVNFAVEAQSPKLSPTATVTPTKTNAPNTVDHNVTALKEKIADKVEELQKKNKTTISGTITNIENRTITVEDRDSKKHLITHDDLLTKVKTITDKTVKDADFSSLKKDQYVVVTGIMLEDVFTPQTIFSFKKYDVISGKVADLNKTEFSVDILITDTRTITVDIESGTKQLSFDKASSSLKKGGFAQIKVGDYIHAVYLMPSENTFSRVSALRTILLPQTKEVTK